MNVRKARSRVMPRRRFLGRVSPSASRVGLACVLGLGACAQIVATLPAAAADLHVDAALGDDARSGSSWADSLATVTAALAAAAGTPEADVVRVAAGTYPERIVVPPGVTLLGGHPSGGGARDVEMHRTILDGRRGGTVVTLGPGTDDCVVDGFTIRNGRGAGRNEFDTALRPGGVMIDRASPILRACVIETCVAPQGGGLLVIEGRPLIESCIFRGNVGLEAAAAVYLLLPPAPGVPRFRGCLFEGNRKTEHPRFGYLGPGGVMRVVGGRGDTLHEEPEPLISGCTFRSNDCWFANVRCPQGCAAVDVGLVRRTVEIENSIFRRNRAAAVQGYANPRIGATLRITNCEFSGHRGHAIRAQCTDGLTAVQCSLADNGFALDGVAWIEQVGQLHFERSVIASPLQDECICRSGEVTASDCVISGGFPTGTNIVDADPLFVRGPNGEYFLSQLAAGQAADAPGVDAGPIDAAAAGLDGMTTRSDGVPDSGAVDWGMHYGPSVPIWPEIVVPAGHVEILRGDAPIGLPVVAVTPALPFTDEPGILSDSTRPLLFYEVRWSDTPIRLAKEPATDTIVILP